MVVHFRKEIHIEKLLKNLESLQSIPTVVNETSRRNLVSSLTTNESVLSTFLTFLRPLPRLTYVSLLPPPSSFCLPLLPSSQGFTQKFERPEVCRLRPTTVTVRFLCNAITFLEHPTFLYNTKSPVVPFVTNYN